MSQGRCAGCGDTGPVPAITAHMAQCGKYAVLYRDHPELCLPPEQEYKRWREQDRAAEVQQGIAAKVGASEVQRAAMADRFRTPNILEDL